MRGIDVAKQMVGLQEIRDRKKLLEFFKKHIKKGEYLLDPSTTPWCARFVTCCEREIGKEGTGKDNARSYLDYGEKVELEDAKEGDIVIFERGNSSWQGHVTYFVKWIDDSDSVQVLGGNQMDKICYKLYPQDKILGIRRS